jgi:hypothetical protein
MAKFCNDECKNIGSICDFCIHYKDKYRDILKLQRGDGSYEFAGEGICGISNSPTDALDGCGCDNFECFLISQKEAAEDK